MGGFEVQPWELAATANMARDAGQSLREELQRLEREVETLRAEWRGHAGSRFAEGWGEWHGGATEVLTALDSLAERLDGTGRGYLAAEAANTGAFG